MGVMKGYRLASVAAGDDYSLTRYIRTDRGEPHKPRRHQPRFDEPGLAPAFVTEGRTKYSSRVRRSNEVRTLLVSGHSNTKIGRDVRKGKFKGYWIYTLTFEERVTCPTSCEHWQSCYGNNMPFAKRLDHTDPALLAKLELEVMNLLAQRPGILIRLHALGDFYSRSYVAFWGLMLMRHPRLAIFGYTAWKPDTPIGAAVQQLIDMYPDRFMIRVSGGRMAERSTVAIVSPEDCPPNAFVCPEQTGKTRCCATCGACWSTLKNVAFLAH